MEPVGYSGVDSRKGAFKMAIKKVNGRWYLYMGHLWHYGWSIVDVTDPKDPKFVKTIPGPANTWTIQMTLHDNIMVTGLEKSSLTGEPIRISQTTRAFLFGTSAIRSTRVSSRTGRPGRRARIETHIRAADTLIYRQPRQVLARTSC